MKEELLWLWHEYLEAIEKHRWGRDNYGSSCRKDHKPTFEGLMFFLQNGYIDCPSTQ